MGSAGHTAIERVAGHSVPRSDGAWRDLPDPSRLRGCCHTVLLFCSADASQSTTQLYFLALLGYERKRATTAGQIWCLQHLRTAAAWREGRSSSGVTAAVPGKLPAQSLAARDPSNNIRSETGKSPIPNGKMNCYISSVDEEIPGKAGDSGASVWKAKDSRKRRGG